MDHAGTVGHTDAPVLDTLRDICTFIGVPDAKQMLDCPHDTTYEPVEPSLVEEWRRRRKRRNAIEMRHPR